MAASVALLVCGTVLAQAVGAGATPAGVQEGTDPETVPTTPEPTPDPAPPPAPAPKPQPKAAPKPAPKPAPRPSTRVTRPAPVETFTPPSFSPAPTVRKAAPQKKRHVVKKPKAKVKKVVAPIVERPLRSPPDAIVRDPVLVGARRVPLATGGDSAVTQILFVGGVTFASLLFLLAAAVPGTPVRFTSVGRVVLDHQQDFVLVGIASLVITVFVYVLTGHGV